jgi:hypothetical protein
VVGRAFHMGDGSIERAYWRIIFFSRGKNSKKILQLFKKKRENSPTSLLLLQSPIPASLSSSGRAPGSTELIRYSPVHRSPLPCCLRRSLRPPALGSQGNFTSTFPMNRLFAPTSKIVCGSSPNLLGLFSLPFDFSASLG